MLRRKKYFIYPKFQMALVLAGSISILACFGFTIALLTSSFAEMKELGLRAGFPENHAYFQFLSMQAENLITKLGIAVALGLIVNTFFFLWISHRVVGPIVSLNAYLSRYPEAIQNGEKINPIIFRRNDFFNELVSNVNKALTSNQELRTPPES